MKASAHLQQRANPTAHFAITFGWVGYTGKHFEERALAGAVAPDDAKSLPAFDLKADIPQSPDLIRFVGAVSLAAQAAADPLHPSGDHIAQGISALL